MKISKRVQILAIIVIGMIAGGLVLTTMFNFIGGLIIGGLTASTIIALLFPNMVNEINPNLNEKRKKRLAKIQFRSFRRTILHPTVLPGFLGILWGGLALFILSAMDTKITSGTFLMLFLPFLFLMGLGGYQIIRRDEYVDRYGHLVRGFPAKLYGYIVTTTFWGAGVLWALANLLHL